MTNIEDFLDGYYLDSKHGCSVGKVPPWLDLEINTNCNTICVKCFRRFYIPKTEHMDLKLARKIIKEFGEKKGKSIRFIERGEPTLSPILAYVVKYAYNLGLRTVINTNCVELNPELSKRLIENGISQISCAIDSCDKKTYELLQGNNFDKVFYNLKCLYELSRGTGTFIQVHVNVQKENAQEVQTGVYKAFFEQYADKVIHQPTYDLYNFEQNVKLDSTPCIEPWRRLIVLADGRVMLCPACFNYKTKQVFLVGDVTVQNVESIWTGSLLRRIRKWHLEGELDNMWPCRSCRLRRYTSEKGGELGK